MVNRSIVLYNANIDWWEYLVLDALKKIYEKLSRVSQLAL